MGTIPSRREDRGLTPLRLWVWISVSAAANACRKYAANSGTPEHNGFSHKGSAGRSIAAFRSARHARDFRILPSFGLVPFASDAANT